ncbi:hypothetical protein [Peribacillus glennii]|uniref:Uncharacterized protein n=1 Tax=Peribacillus glennii TaxID=2303991 RepID=A0A372L8P7_9BACI|nr:hypothetical protein [Peribacillus glennii]RFU61438.1 hypothetical protein D0466_18320 [Peribacillus glennii]
MVVPFIWVIFISYFVMAAVSYFYLRKSRNLISYHFGMNIAMTSSGVMGISCGIILGNQFPLFFSEVTFLTLLIAISAGAIFGSLVDYQTLVTGVSNGIMAGIMGPMLGLAAELPLLVIATFLVFLGFGLLCFSLRSL